ncbi:hypothetical protein EUTSA_v10001790mg, partial [Eutrema salsugineum]
ACVISSAISGGSSPAEVDVVASGFKDSFPSPWVSKVRSFYQKLSKVASPSFGSDGTPVVRAPDSITLGSSQVWKDHLIAYFHGNPPSPTKIFSDLNPIQGKQGRISVKSLSSGVCLIYIPCEVTRNWVLDVGFWHSGNCSFTVSLWSPLANLAPMKLVHTPIWVLFKNLPQELWSFQGFSTIASGIGIPVHSESSKLPPYSNSIAKLKVVVELAKQRSSSVCVTDKLGNSVVVFASYPSLPPRCRRFKEFGHLELRCPEGIISSSGIKSDSVGKANPVPLVVQCVQIIKVPTIAPAADVPPSALSRSRSLPSCSSSPILESEGSDSGGWTRVAKKSKPPSPSSSELARNLVVRPVTSSQFAEEEELIQTAQ